MPNDSEALGGPSSYGWTQTDSKYEEADDRHRHVAVKWQQTLIDG